MLSRWIDALAHALASPLQIGVLISAAVCLGYWPALPAAILCGLLNASIIRTGIDIRERADLIRSLRNRYAEPRP
jgi:hypothetical protein